MHQQMQQKRRSLSAKAYIERQEVATKGTGCVQLPDGVTFLKFKNEGSLKIDVLPFRVSNSKHKDAVDGLWYVQDYYVHKNVGDSNRRIICPKAQIGKPCPICEYRMKLDRHDPQDVAVWKELTPQLRQLYNVVIPGEDTVYIFDQAQFSFGRLVTDLIRNADEEDDNYQYFADLNDGVSIKLNLINKTYNQTAYIAISSVEMKNRKHTYDDSWLDKTVDLEKCLVILPYDEIKEIHYGLSGNCSKPDNEDAWGDAIQQTTKAKKAKVVEDEDEDNDDVQDFNPNPSPKPAASKPKPTAAKPAPKIDDDDDDDDVPVRTKKVTKSVDKWNDDEDDGDDTPF
jgi:hypothetical protein